jgi:hypothetical protein
MDKWAYYICFLLFTAFFTLSSCLTTGGLFELWLPGLIGGGRGISTASGLREGPWEAGQPGSDGGPGGNARPADGLQLGGDLKGDGLVQQREHRWRMLQAGGARTFRLSSDP